MRKIKCKTGEIAKTYKEYLKTDHWKLVKKRFFDSINRLFSHDGYKNFAKWSDQTSKTVKF